MNRKRIARVMRERDIRGVTRRKHRSLTRPDKMATPAPDPIGRDFHAKRPGTKLVGDITYLPTAEGWLYLACWLDLATREVVGYAMADHHRAELVVDALEGRWQREDSYHSYDNCIPIVATTLELLREHGPAGPAFWRFGRDHREPLLDAIGNPRRDAALARRHQTAREEQRRREEEEAAAREARRPVCTDCGQKFSDDRWTAVDVRDWAQSRESHPHLCDDCQSRAAAAEKQAEADERERQEQERLHQEADAEQAARKAGGWLGRWRT